MATIYFSHCWGVFEGGGVRAAAHAGAYAAAREAGISFGRVAGTSGGSIVAALIAAGASAEYITEQLQQTDLSQFLSSADPRESVFAERSWKLKLLRGIAMGKLKLFATVALNSGIYNSRPLQDWLESHLLRLVSHRREIGTRGPVRFSELLLPLHVVATDLTTGKPKIWSRESTPDESVAFAVRCSCSIPFFYQAVGSQQAVLVDGGAVSNLPSYVFTQLLRSGEQRNVLSRVLAFRLVEDTNHHQVISNLADFAVRLSSTVIDGASHIQSTLQPNVYDVVIPTGSIRSTDFGGIGEREKNELHEAGLAAVRRFVGDERIIVRSSNATPLSRGFDEKLLLLVQELQNCESAFLAIGTSTYWLDFIFPTVLSIARRGIQMVCICEHPKTTEERRRLSLLSRLGADIVNVADGLKTPFDGFLFDVATDRASAIVSTMDGSVAGLDHYSGELVRLYTRDSDPAVLELLSEKVVKHWTPKSVARRSLPYSSCSEQDFFNLLRNVPQYAQADFQFGEVEVCDKILVLQQAVKEFKALQIKRHIEDLKTHGCDLFELRQVALLRGPGTIVTPPVLERVNSETLVLIEGNSRFFHCMAEGVKSVRAVIVENISAKLPAQQPRPLSSLSLISYTTTLAGNYRNIEKSLFRRIEEAVHPYVPD